jgi:hypothetical protein
MITQPISRSSRLLIAAAPLVLVACGAQGAEGLNESEPAAQTDPAPTYVSFPECAHALPPGPC